MRRVSGEPEASWQRSVALAVLAIATTAVPADAQNRSRWPSENGAAYRAAPYAPRPRAQPQAQPAVAAVSSPIEPLLGVVSLDRQSVTFYAGTARIAEAPVSSGQQGHRTPTGVFSIIQKARYHESNIYSGAPMPFMQRLTWSGIALHAGALPGYPASHGCIRLPHAFAERLFSMTRLGARIVVAAEPLTPVAFAHDRLPVPKFNEIRNPSPAPVVTASAAPMTVGAALVSPAEAAPASIVLLPPKKAAEHEKRRAAKAVGELQRAAKEALQIAAATAVAAENAKPAIRAAEDTVADMQKRLARAQALVTTATNDEDRTQAEASVAVLEEDLAEARHLVAAARHAEQVAADQALAVAVAARKAEEDAIDAEEQARIAQRGTDPLTVFLSRKDNRAYLRQGLTPLMEGEITIEDMTAPIGTHVITAVEADEAGAKLSWTALSIPESGQPSMSAEAALNRITFAPKLADEIAHRAWPGLTIIVSDHPISGETGKGTDFIVLTK